MPGVKAEEARGMVDAQLEALSEALAAGRSEGLQAFLTAMARFHRYSLGNTLLIMVQRPEATHVAGFGTWLKLGRTVRKGERGIAILAPTTSRAKGRADDEGTKEKEDEEEGERPVRFRVAYVFDVEQTAGEPLPGFARPQGEPGDYLGRLRGLVGDLDIDLEYRESLGGAQGVSSGGLIAIKARLSPAEEFSTLVHELAHETLHKGEARRGTTLGTRELQAEAVAFVVSQGIGVESTAASADYIQLYGGSKEALAASLEAIREASRAILSGLFEDRPQGRTSSQPASDAPVAERSKVAQPSLFD